DLAYLRFESGRRGYRAAQSLREHPAFVASEADMETLEEVLARTTRWRSGPQPDGEALDAEGLRAPVGVAEGSVDPGEDWWQAVGREDCRGDSPCVLLTPDLDADGEPEALLCQVDWPSGGTCRLFARGGDVAWARVAQATLWQTGHESRQELL